MDLKKTHIKKLISRKIHDIQGELSQAKEELINSWNLGKVLRKVPLF